MIQRILSIAAAILLIGTGCSRSISAPQSSGGQPESAGSQAEASAPEMNFANDAKLHRAILVNYGADCNTGTEGKPLEAHQGASLFRKEDWDSEHPMPAFDYFGWNFGQMWNEDIPIEERQTKYAHPSDKEYTGYFFPQALYEERARQYFDVSVDELRSITEYDAENEGYHMQAGFGMGGVPQIELRKAEQQEDVLKLYLTLVYDPANPALSENKILSVRMAEDGSYRYIGYATENEESAFSGEAVLSALAPFTIAGYDYEPGDFSHQFTLTDAQQSAFQKLLRADQWEEMTELHEHGFTTFLRAGNPDGYRMSVGEWHDGKSFVAITNSPDSDESTYYLAPGEVVEDAKTLVESLKTQSPEQSTALETAVFALGTQGGAEKTMRAGDAIGDWTLSDLQIEHSAEDRAAVKRSADLLCVGRMQKFTHCICI